MKGGDLKMPTSTIMSVAQLIRDYLQDALDEQNGELESVKMSQFSQHALTIQTKDGGCFLIKVIRSA